MDDHQKWLPYQILGGKTLNNVQIDRKTTDMVDKAKRDIVSVEGVCEICLIKDISLSFFLSPSIYLSLSYYLISFYLSHSVSLSNSHLFPITVYPLIKRLCNYF